MSARQETLYLLTVENLILVSKLYLPDLQGKSNTMDTADRNYNGWGGIENIILNIYGNEIFHIK